MRASPLGKNVQDQGSAVKDIDAQSTSQISFLDRRKAPVDQHQAGLVLGYQLLKFVNLAGTNQELRVRTLAGGEHLTNHLQPGGVGEVAKLCLKVRVVGGSKRVQQQGPIAARLLTRGVADQESTSPSSGVNRTLREGTTVEIACL